MALGKVFEGDLLKLIFNATTLTGIAVNDTGTPLTNIDVALHTADPTATGTQDASEIAYTGYARVSVARTSGGWTISGTNPAQVVPAAAVNFGKMTAGAGGTVTYFSCGFTGGGATKIICSGTVTPNIVVSNGVTPQLTAATALTLT
jgi:hypothetical protein